MKRKIFRRFDKDLESVFEAYYISICNLSTSKNIVKRENLFIRADFGFSFKYNTNGSAAILYFCGKDNVTYVEILYCSAQLFGAKYKKFELDLYNLVYTMLQVEGELCKSNEIR